MAGEARTIEDLNGLMRLMMKSAIERMLNTEMDVHLGRRPAAGPTEESAAETTLANDQSPAENAPAARPKKAPNRRNSRSKKTVRSETGELTIATPRDRDGTFEPQLIGKHQLLPMTPDFAEWLLRTPESEREGPVFRVIGLQTGQPITPKRVSRVVTKIGRKAGVVVNRETKKVKEDVLDKYGHPTGWTKLVEREVAKPASAHDQRRSFGSRWAKRVMPATLKLLMRHSSVDTTMRYYVEMDADAVAADLWAQHQSESTPENQGLGTIDQPEAQGHKKDFERSCSKPLSGNEL